MTDKSGDSRDFLDQARWLLEWHNKRSEALTTRAVALLGFVGVIFTLLLQGATIKDLDPTVAIKVLLVVTAAALFVTAALALRCIATTSVKMPSVQGLQLEWAKHQQKPEPGAGAPNLTEEVLDAQGNAEVSPLESAKDEADERAKRFKAAAWVLVVALVLLAILTVTVLLHAWGR